MAEAFFQHEPLSISSDLMDLLAKRHRFSKRWDADFFREAYKKLGREFERANEAERRTMMMDRYYDVTDPYESSGKVSSFEDHFAMPVPELDPEDLPRIMKSGSIAAITESDSASHTLTRPVEIFQYGPSRIYSVPPGGWVEIKNLEEQDLIGTTYLTSCTALVAHDGEKYFLAHVLGSKTEEIRALLTRLREKPSAAIQFIVPFWRKKSGEEVTSWNQRLKNLADEFSVAPQWYPYIGSSTSEEEGIDWTTVIVGRDFIRSVGTRSGEAQNPFRADTPGKKPRYRTKAIPRTIHDMGI